MKLNPKVDEFLSKHVDSIEALEILLLVWRSERSSWQAPEVAARVGIAESVARAKLEEFYASGLVDRDEHGFRAASGDSKRATLLSELQREYTEHRVHVINAIYSANLERLKEFAEAFRLRKK